MGWKTKSPLSIVINRQVTLTLKREKHWDDVKTHEVNDLGRPPPCDIKVDYIFNSCYTYHAFTNKHFT